MRELVPVPSNHKVLVRMMALTILEAIMDSLVG